MEYIKIEVDPRTLTSAEWGSFTPPSMVKLPRIYRIEDGAAKVYFSRTLFTWVSQSDAAFVEVLKDTPPSALPAPNVGISESTLLKAIALAQDPSLIITFEFK